MITQEELKRVLHYDPDTGVFTRAVPQPGWKVGSVAGGYRGGYWRVQIGGARYSAHRLAFLYMTGTFPTLEIDHVNGVKDDNRWCNLRLATRSQNVCNSGSRVGGNFGVKGVHWKESAQCWVVQVRGERGAHFSRHKCLLNAVATAYRLQKIIHGEFANHG